MPPPQLDVNIPLVSAAAPEVSTVLGRRNGVEVVFSQYMDIESFAGKVRLLVNGSEIDCALTFPDKEVSGTDDTVFYARKLRVSPSDGTPLSGQAEVEIQGTVENYAGRALGETYVSPQTEIRNGVGEIRMESHDLLLPAGCKLTLHGRALDDCGAAAADAILTVQTGSENVKSSAVMLHTDKDGYFSLELKGCSAGACEVTVLSEDGCESTVTVLVSSAADAAHPATGSQAPYLLVLGRNGEIRQRVTKSGGVLRLRQGDKLLLKQAMSAETGYVFNETAATPVLGDSYTVPSGAFEPAAGVYTAAAIEPGRTASLPFSFTVEISEAADLLEICSMEQNVLTCTVRNTADSLCSGTLIAALYDTNGRMLCSASAGVSLAAGTEETKPLRFDSIPDRAVSAKVFFLKTGTSFEPISPAGELTLPRG